MVTKSLAKEILFFFFSSFINIAFCCVLPTCLNTNLEYYKSQITPFNIDYAHQIRMVPSRSSIECANIRMKNQDSLIWKQMENDTCLLANMIPTNDMERKDTAHIRQNSENMKLIILSDNLQRKSVEVIQMGEPTDLSCVSIPELPEEAHDGLAAVLGGRALVCAASGKCHIFDPDTNSWVTAPDLDQTRKFPGILKLSPDQLWITGGNGGSKLKSTIIYSLSGFESGPDLETPVNGHCVAWVNRTHIFVGGGFSGNKQEARLLDWSTKAWTRLADTLEPHHFHDCITLYGKIYVPRTKNGVGYMEYYDLKLNDVWRLGPPIPSTTKHWLNRVVPYKDSFLMIGGIKLGNQKSDTIYEFLPSNGSWIEHAQKLAFPKTYFHVLAITC